MSEAKAMSEIIEQYGKEQFNKGRQLGYDQAIEDFYDALITTHMTPGEIYKKLSPRQNPYD